MLSYGVHGGGAGVSKLSGLAKVGPANHFTDTLPRQMIHVGPSQRKCARALSVKTSNSARPVWKAGKTIAHNIVRAQPAFLGRTGLHGGGMTQQRGIWIGWIMRTLKISWTFRFRPGKKEDHGSKPHAKYEADEAHPSSHTLSNHTPASSIIPDSTAADSSTASSSTPDSDSSIPDSSTPESSTTSHIQSDHKSSSHKSTSKRRKKWTEEETTTLLEGVARFGIGNWKKILDCPDFSFNGRTAVDLKDRFRKYCQDENRKGKTPKTASAEQNATASATEVSTAESVSGKQVSSLVTSKTLLPAGHKHLDNTPCPSEERISKGKSLTTEQKIVLDFVLHQDKSVFFTGPAGTGKSFLLRKIIAALRAKYISKPEEVTVTASTGIAATNIGGQTLHSFAGVGLGTGAAEELLTKIKKDKNKRKQWKTVKVLIIDEISMIDGEFFDKLDRIARGIRGSRLPFGGVQLVVTGDFYQLPPVSRTHSAMFAFESESWRSTIDHTICLTHIFRQKDPIFTEMLNELREACLSSDSIQRFRSLDRPLNLNDGLEPSKLFPLRTEVDRENHAKLDRLLGDIRTFTSEEWGLADEKGREQLLSGCITPQILRLKKGAQVMLTKNLNTTLVNGTLGKIVGFAGKASFRSKPSWIQGDWSYSGKSCGPDAIDDDDMQYPVVRFTCVDGSTYDRLCSPEVWTVEERVQSEPGEEPKILVLAARKQVPLILAWALSIHKSQGQSLDFVKVDLGRVFERGQAYVALSRATSMDGLQVLNFDPGKVRTHQKVKDFYQKLSVISTANKELQSYGLREAENDGKRKKQ